MKINATSQNCSFKALLLERKPISQNQEKIINNITKTILDSKYYIYLLENKYTDIYISPNNDGKSVDLKLLAAAGLTYNFVPKDKNGEVKTSINIPQTYSIKNSNDKKKIANNIQMRTGYFIQRCLDCVLDCMETPENKAKLRYFENLSNSDLLANKIQNPEIIPNAQIIYGEPVITTKNC